MHPAGSHTSELVAGRSAGLAARRLEDASMTPRLVTLKRRPEFLSVRGGARWAAPAFVLEARRRVAAKPLDTTSTEVARFGFTVSKQVGGAVERNRIKRRLKAAVRDILLEHARPNYDYVLIARRPALDAAYSLLVSGLADALGRVHARSERLPRGKSTGARGGADEGGRGRA